MPRRGPGRRPAPRARSRSPAPRARSRKPAPRARSHSPAPRSVHHAPPPDQPSSGIVGTVAEGLAFGTGIAAGNRVVDAMLGPQTIQHQTVITDEGVSAAAPATSPVTNTMVSGACDVQYKAFQDCLNGNKRDISKCQSYMDMLSECRRNSASMDA